MLSCLVNSHAFHALDGFPWFYILCFPCFPMVLYSILSMLSWGILLQFSCSMLAWKAWKFPYENHGILLQLHAPWFSRESIEFPPCFSMVFPWFSHAFSIRVSEKLSVHAVWFESAWKNEKPTTVAMGSLLVLLCSSVWYIPGLHLSFISLAAVDIKSIHGLWLLVQSLTAS